MKSKANLTFPQKFGLKTQLVVTYLLLITIPLSFFGYQYYSVSKNVVSDIVQKNVYEIVKKNNEIMDTKLSQVTDNILSFMVDKDLYSTFSEIKPEEDYQINLLDKKISVIMDKYFSHSPDIYSSQLATSYYTFGPTMASNNGGYKNFIPSGVLENTQLYQTAIKSDGRIEWIPTYEFSSMFHLDYMKDANVEYRHMFSAVEMINGSYFDGLNYHTFPPNIEKPVLIVNYKADFFQKAFTGITPVDGSYFFVVTKEGDIVSHQDPTQISKKAEWPWLHEIVDKGSGTANIQIDGKNRIICFDTSKVTGWTSAVVIPPDQLLGKILDTMKTYIIYSVFILLIISFFTSYFITDRITKPIRNMLKAIKKTGEGNFDASIKEEGSRELAVLSKKYNEMNGKIQRLIEENYESKIKEKEAEITALNLQLDPHFMYNTLNLINLISVENGQDEVSEMIVSLSTMLKYTVKSQKPLVPFKDDWEYLKSYIYIMTKRFEGKFHFEYEMDPGLFVYGVPKFFLQPFVENALVHAFDSQQMEGVIKISCWIEDVNRYFRIEDNGKGIAKEMLEHLLDEKNDSIGIQNVNKRIRITYGENYGLHIESEEGKGTKVTIWLPQD
ncbi:two-component system sensor histidine kinase YesM [Paenibacillus sp. V4I9]|uniref:sensor histidine kinase n=1 Tax=Paenibacillus sp. V4I9 TaxID=3042308 RepID=UPI00278756C8|nr:sensor histidine kinase [Paenibacillus sp. V4I9]MDQ0886748.1 two-component system sensor histidine kinase YesM [Paenibacillus sp. V4I9]